MQRVAVATPAVLIPLLDTHCRPRSGHLPLCWRRALPASVCLAVFASPSLVTRASRGVQLQVDSSFLPYSRSLPSGLHRDLYFWSSVHGVTYFLFILLGLSLEKNLNVTKMRSHNSLA